MSAPAPADPVSTRLLGSTVPEVQRVGRAFRGLLIWFALQQLVGLFIRFLPLASDSGRGNEVVLGLVAIGALVGLLAATVMLLIQVYRLTSGMGSSMAVLWTLGMLVPCVSLILLLVLNSNAKTWLEQRGIPVGLIGPSKSDLDRLAGGIAPEQGAGFTRI